MPPIKFRNHPLVVVVALVALVALVFTGGPAHAQPAPAEANKGGAATINEALTGALTALKDRDTSAYLKFALIPDAATKANAEVFATTVSVSKFELGTVTENDGHAYVKFSWSAKLDVDAMVAGLVLIDVEAAKASGKPLDEKQIQAAKARYAKSLPAYRAIVERAEQMATLERHDGRWFVLEVVGQ